MARLEVQAILLQCLLVAAFALAVRQGLIVNTSLSSPAVLGIAAYHAFLVLYVLLLRLRDRKLALVEFIVPVCDALCITGAWIAIADARSPIWSLYLYILVATGRRVGFIALGALTAFMLANMIFTVRHITGDGWLATLDNADLAIMSGVTVSIAMLAHAIGQAWTGAERSALDLARTDPLTGLANRRSFTVVLDEMLADPDAQVAVLMLDLDNFKTINDTLGHQEGDAVLLKAAQLAASCIREGDLIGRYGGEEFIIALPGATAFEAEIIAERVRQQISSGTPTSVSIGVAGRWPAENAESLIRRADSLMFSAKRGGKNRVRTDARAA